VLARQQGAAYLAQDFVDLLQHVQHHRRDDHDA
jgi:hypothetical protein